MRKKREIYALDYAIVVLVSSLDHLFRSAINPLELNIAGGLNVEMDPNQPSYDVKVFVRPSSWTSEGEIFARFEKGNDHVWRAFEGNLVARHLPYEFSRFAFRCDLGWNGRYRFQGRGTSDEVLLSRLLATRIATYTKLIDI